MGVSPQFICGVTGVISARDFLFKAAIPEVRVTSGYARLSHRTNLQKVSE